MNTQRRQRWIALAGAAVLVGAGLGPTAAPVGAATDGGEKRTTTQTADGLVVEQITRGDDTVTTYGAPGAQVRWLPAGDTEALVEIIPPATSASTGTGSTAVRGAVAPTVYEMSLASGMSAAQACEFARDMDDRGCRTSSEVEAAASRTPSPTVSASASASASSIHDSWCYDFKTTKGDGTKHNHACTVRYVDSSTTSYVWLGNKMKATGWVRDPGWVYDRLKGVGMQLRYLNERSTAVDWDPYSTQSIGSCRSSDVSVEGRNGATYSSSAEICPDRLSPWASSDFQYFGARWTSSEEAPADENRGVIATSLQRIPKNSAGGSRASIHAWLSWS